MPRSDKLCSIKYWIFQQYSASLLAAKSKPTWLHLNCQKVTMQDVWSPSSPPVSDYYGWFILEAEVNNKQYRISDSFKAFIFRECDLFLF